MEESSLMTLYLSNRDGNGKTSEEGHFKFQTSVFSGNVLGDTSLQVTQNSPLARSVLIAPGQFKIDTSSDYSYTGWNSVSTTQAISTADPSNPRITSIVVYVDKAAATSSTPPNNPGIVKFTAVNGTPAASPVAPSGATIQAAIGIGNPYIVLANVTVPAGATTILNANISDQRTKVSVGTNLVVTNSIIDSAITTGKILNGAITSDKLATNSVTNDKIANSSISATKLNNPYKFSAYKSADTTVGDSATYNIVFNTELFDTNSNYNNTTGIYTVPITGYYYIAASVLLRGATGAGYLWEARSHIYQNATIIDTADIYVYDQGRLTFIVLKHSDIFYLNAGDAIKVSSVMDRADNASGTVSGGRANTRFSGYLIST